MRSRRLVPIVLALVVVPLSGAASARNASGPPDFDRLPVAAAGALPGKIVYLKTGSCELRSHDLTSGDDQLIRSKHCSDLPTISPDGRYTLTGGAGQLMTVTDQAGHTIHVGAPGKGLAPIDTQYRASFSPDSTRVLTCTWINRQTIGYVSSTTTGKNVARVSGTCNVAFTQQGLAVLRGGKLRVAGRIVAHFTGRGPFVLAANQAGTLLGVSAGPPVVGRPSTGVTVTILLPTGHVVSRYHRADITIPFSIVQLAPKGGSAPAWWGDISQTAVFAGKTFKLVYGDQTPVDWPAYSPDGRYVLLPRDYAPGEPEGDLPDAVIADAQTFRPLYRVPFSATAAAWTS